MTKKRLYEIIFEADTRAGKIFDLALLGVILFSIVLVVLDSVEEIHKRYTLTLVVLEWVVTILFTIEYLVRIWLLKKPLNYVFSLYGLIDLCALLPSYIGLLLGGGSSLMVIRTLRFLRIFRILKLTRYTRAGRMIMGAIWESKEKIYLFTIFVVTLATIVGTMMYLIEGDSHGFKDIPTSVYWAIVTLTTVGYGDLSPATGIGQFLASLVMIMGYAIIAVPTGIVTASFLSRKEYTNTQVCPNCLFDKHDDDAAFCKKCGTALEDEKLKG